MCRLFGYEKVYLPLHKVADTPFHIQGDDVLSTTKSVLCSVTFEEEVNYISHVLEHARHREM